MEPPIDPYEREALAQIRAFKNPPVRALPRAVAMLARASSAIDRATDAAFDNALGGAVTKLIGALVQLLNDGASWSVRADAVYAEYRRAGHHDVHSAPGVSALSLEHVDAAVRNTGRKYLALAAAEGAVAGAAGGAALLVDVPALVGLALRCVNEYATYYGFECATVEERAYAVRVLSVASAASHSARREALEDLTRFTLELSSRRGRGEMQSLLGVPLMKKLAETLGLRLARAKLAQAVPVVGAVVGGSFNGWFLEMVSRAAFMLYRERFLFERYGPAALVPVGDRPVR